MNEQTKAQLNTIFNIDASASTSNSADLVVVPEIISSELAPASSSVDNDAERLAQEDFEFSRGALKSVAVEAQTMLHRATEVASQTDTPRAFEAVGDLVRATLETHRELQSLHKTAAEVRLATKASTTPASQVNIDKGIVFNGSPDELLKLIDPSRQ